MPLPMFRENKSRPSDPAPVILAVAAGKGGVGKSTVAVNLALALKLKGFKIGLMDTDVYGPSARKMLPEDKLPSQKDSFIMPAECKGIKMISMAYFRKDNEASVVRAPIANQIIAQFIEKVQWGELDFLIIDFPPGTGDIQLTLSQKAKLSGAVMVTTPQEVAVMDVRKAINMFNQVNVPIIGIIENMSGYYHPKTKEILYLFGNGGGERLADEAGVPFLGRIPIDPELSRKGDLGESIFDDELMEPHSAAKAFLTLAEKIAVFKKEGFRNNAIDLQSVSLDQNHQILTLNWKDGEVIKYRLSELQQNCPCAGCVDENTGERLVDPAQIQPDVRALSISQVGRYAIKIDFSSGCCHGIYTFDMLKRKPLRS